MATVIFPLAKLAFVNFEDDAFSIYPLRSFKQCPTFLNIFLTVFLFISVIEHMVLTEFVYRIKKWLCKLFSSIILHYKTGFFKKKSPSSALFLCAPNNIFIAPCPAISPPNNKNVFKQLFMHFVFKNIQNQFILSLHCVRENQGLKKLNTLKRGPLEVSCSFVLI